ncbi:MAG: hypothetical protein AAF846_13120 [Chloroflexota bacterium]
MQAIRTLLSFILALIAIPLMTIAACNFAIEAAVFNRTTYNAVLDDNVIFDELANSLFPLIIDAPIEDLTIEGEENLPIRVQEIGLALQDKPDVLADITAELFPSETVQEIITGIVDAFFAITNGDSDAIEREIDLSVIRERLNGESAVTVATRIIDEVADCTPQQLEQLTSFIDTDEGILPICKPDDDGLRLRSISTLENWLRDIGDNSISGDRVTVSEFLNISRDDARAVGIISDLLFNQALMLFFLCPLGILSMVIILSVRRLNDFGRWIGGVTIAVGSLLILLIIGLQIFAFGTISGLLESTTTTSEVFIARFVSGLMRSAINASSTSLLTQSAIFIGIGFFLMGLAWYLGRHRDDTNGDVVLITEDGQVISTATQRRIGTIDPDS